MLAAARFPLSVVGLSTLRLSHSTVYQVKQFLKLSSLIARLVAPWTLVPVRRVLIASWQSRS